MLKHKILLVITKSNWGGAQKYVFDLATRLSPETFDVSVLFGGHGILAEKLEEKKIRTISFPNMWRDVNLFNDIHAFFKLFSLFRKEKPHIVHLNSSKIGGLGALAARLAGVRKIVFTVHGWAFNEDRPYWQKIIIKSISWITTFLCTDIIFISQKELIQSQHWPLVSHKFKLIHNGIQAPAFLSKEQALSKLPHVDGKIIVGTIAELTKNKGLIYALEAFKSLPDHIFIIIGDGEEKINLEKYIQENNLGGRVFLAGFVQDAVTLLTAFDIFLLSSLKEGLPYVILEAGSAGLPVIATNVGAVNEIIQDKKTGLLIEPRSSEGIKNGLMFLKNNPHERENFGKNLKEKVSQEFSFETMIADTSKLYSA